VWSVWVCSSKNICRGKGMARKGVSIMSDILDRQKMLKKIFRNSECDRCGDYLSEVHIKGSEVLCDKCFKGKK
jgi:formylmethanofuran dehydrogenase subunit E